MKELKCLNTDWEIIKTNALENECPVPFLRPKYLASHKAKTKDLIEYISKKVDYHDYLIILQPTSPLRDQKDIEALKAELSDPRFSTGAWQDQINMMLENGKKAEQQSLAKYGLDYVTDEYLPQKLAEFGLGG